MGLADFRFGMGRRCGAIARTISGGPFTKECLKDQTDFKGNLSSLVAKTMAAHLQRTLCPPKEEKGSPLRRAREEAIFTGN